MTRIADRLKYLRKFRKLSVCKIVKLLKQKNLNYSEQSIYKWEEGSILPPVKALSAISKIYDCNISYIISGQDTEYKRITPSECVLLNLYRNDFQFRSIATLIMNRFDKV